MDENLTAINASENRSLNRLAIISTFNCKEESLPKYIFISKIDGKRFERIKSKLFPDVGPLQKDYSSQMFEFLSRKT